MRRIFARWCADESGQSLTEYGLILLLASIVAVGALTGLGTAVLEKLYQPSAAMF